jgi:CheY-like chemotaxis protein
VTVAHDGQTALQKIQALHPDLVVLDVLMPNMNGRELRTARLEKLGSLGQIRVSGNKMLTTC